jgi:membrane associated rhomboid family serine protease
MFPYKDENPTLRVPVVTVALIAANLLAWILVQGAGSEGVLEQSVCGLGVIPARLFGTVAAGAPIRLGQNLYCDAGSFPAWATILTSMFMHGGWLHLLGNMWFLWVFGNNIEDSTGRFRFVAFYLLCGIVAALTQSVLNPGSRVPMVGASGAISGVMGAYVVLFPKVRVHMLIFLGFYITTIVVPAYLMLGYWFLLQILGGGLAKEMGGTAFWAHVGGFAAGMVLVFPFRSRALLERRAANFYPP